MNVIALNIPIGGRQISWLHTSMAVYRETRNNSLMVTAGFEPATSGFQVRCPNHSALLRPRKTYNKKKP